MHSKKFRKKVNTIITYTIRVKTGDEKDAETNANVHIKLFGETGESDTIKLKHGFGHNGHKFRRGCTDEFIMKAPDHGDLWKIEIGHDNKGKGPGWLLDKVTIEVLTIQRIFTFAHGKWLDSTVNKDTQKSNLVAEIEGEGRPMTSMEMGESETDGGPGHGTISKAHPGTHQIKKSPGKAGGGSPGKVLSTRANLENTHL